MALQPSDILSTIDSEQFNEFELDTTTSSTIHHSVASQSTSRTTSKVAKLRTSLIWDFTKVGRYDITFNIHGKESWCCKFCSKEYTIAGGTNIIIKHLKERHSIDFKTPQEQRIDGYQSTIAVAFARPHTINHKRRRLDNITAVTPLDPCVLEDLYVRWIVACGIAFQMVSIPEFRT
jgi:hypothetical protein